MRYIKLRYTTNNMKTESSYDAVLKNRPAHLIKIIAKENPESLSELAKSYGENSVSGVNRAVKWMEEDGYVKKQDTGKGRGHIKPVLTEKGEKIAEVVNHE